ncbi:hypothetical protein SK128_016455 [Halocaridina rubra]|uniref:C2H2-type domain-containing protein n=1 Tax=Halocaridina rubra TaxID=373956 RepID=A0AAN8X390_HALRR
MSVNNITLLNYHESIHNRGGILDLTFISDSLKQDVKWRVHPHVTTKSEICQSICVNIKTQEEENQNEEEGEEEEEETDEVLLYVKKAETTTKLEKKIEKFCRRNNPHHFLEVQNGKFQSEESSSESDESMNDCEEKDPSFVIPDEEIKKKLGGELEKLDKNLRKSNRELRNSIKEPDKVGKELEKFDKDQLSIDDIEIKKSEVGKSSEELAKLVNVEKLDKELDKLKNEIEKSAFNSKANLKQHFLIHSGEKPHVCSICQKSFAKKENLKKHSLLHMGNHPCDICTKSFSSEEDLEKHRFIHSREKPFTCETCSKSFCTKQILKRHGLIHTAEKSYVCYICNESFSRKGALQKHSVIHYKEDIKSAIADDKAITTDQTQCENVNNSNCSDENPEKDPIKSNFDINLEPSVILEEGQDKIESEEWMGHLTEEVHIKNCEKMCIDAQRVHTPDFTEFLFSSDIENLT